MMAGQEAMSGFLALVNASDGDFDKLSKAIRESEGEAGRQAKTMNANLKGQLKQFQSVTESIGISIYDKFKKPLTKAFAAVNGSLGDLNKSITNGELAGSFDRLGESVGVLVKALADGLIVALPVVVSLFTWLVDNGDTVIAMLGGIGAGFAAFKVAAMLQAVTTALEGVSVATAICNAVMAVNPLFWIAAAIAAVVAGLILLWQNWDKVTAVLGTAWEKFKQFGVWLRDKFMSIISPIADKVRAISEGFKSFGNKIFGGSDTEKHNALGTSYFSGGRTYVNEGNRGELINLPSGSQIVPHDLAKQAVNKQPNITINLSVAGNVIGNEDFYSECGNAISTRLIAALGNVQGGGTVSSILNMIVSRLITAKMSAGSKASVVISADNGAIVLPIVPADLPEVSNPQNNETFESVLGTMSVMGTLGLRKVSLKGLLPVDVSKYPYANPLGSTAAEVINFINQCRAKNNAARIVIAYSDGSVYLNMACLINSFEYYIDNVKDYHYRMELLEYRSVSPLGGLVS